VNILSTWNDGGYRVLSGTSMATPHVSGVAAVIRTRNPAFTAAQARSKLDASVDDEGAAGRDAQYGFGRVNLAKAAS
jgi:subtilisin family serine protease